MAWLWVYHKKTKLSLNATTRIPQTFYKRGFEASQALLLVRAMVLNLGSMIFEIRFLNQ